MTESAVVRLEVPERPVGPDILRLALPVLAEQMLYLCVSFFDVFLSGRIGTEATAAIGLAAYVSWLASMIFGLIGAGATAIVARAWGAGQQPEAHRIATQAQAMALVLGTMVFGLLQLMAPWTPALLGMQGRTYEIAVQFLRIDAFGQWFACWTLIAAAALRGSGDMRTPLYVLGVTNLVNMTMSTACVYGWGPVPELGVAGIAIGTLIAQICGAVLMAVALRRGWSRLRLVPGEFRFVPATAVRILKIGGPAGLEGAATFTAHFLFLMVIARLSPGGFDGSAFAAHVVGVRFEAVSYLPALAWGLAAASLVGQSLGAHQSGRALQVGRVALRQILAYAFLMGVIFAVAAPQIFAAMHKDPAVAAQGVPAFRLLAAFQVPNAVVIVLACCLRGAGDTKFPLLCVLVGTFCLRLPLGYLFGVVLEGGLIGAWIGMGADNFVRAGLLWWRYQSGRWIRQSL